MYTLEVTEKSGLVWKKYLCPSHSSLNFCVMILCLPVRYGVQSNKYYVIFEVVDAISNQFAFLPRVGTEDKSTRSLSVSDFVIISRTHHTIHPLSARVAIGCSRPSKLTFQVIFSSQLLTCSKKKIYSRERETAVSPKIYDL